MRVWRISKARYAKAAFSGEGARLFDARWNFAGAPMVYTSSSLALAMVEFFVHLQSNQAPDDLISLAADIPGDLSVERIEPETLPANWHKVDLKHLRKIGTNWVKAKTSVAMIVPSAVVEGEWNVLINPLHPDFPKIVIGEAKPFDFDERMFKRA